MNVVKGKKERRKLPFLLWTRSTCENTFTNASNCQE